MKIGIDLGTTNSVVAIVEPKGTRILDNREGEQMTPSVVASKKGEIIVGSVAKKRLAMDPANTIYSVKRLMGRGIKDEEVKKMINEVSYKIISPQNGTNESLSVILNDREYSPVEISSLILKKIKNDVEYKVGEEVKDAVITVPAYFSEIQKTSTREAGILAGLNVLQIIDEPTAAAISYGIIEEDETDEPKIALVFDLGGGTFDISVIALSGGSTVQLNLEGNMWLGGDNFDQVIIDKILKELKEEEGIDAKGNSKLMAAIKIEAQKAKEILSVSRSTDIILDSIDFETEITREQFEEGIKPLISKCQTLVDTSIKGAGFDGPDDIDIVIMAGNSTLIPAVQESMEAKFGVEKIKRKMHPKLCVADGAAKRAGIIPEGEIFCPKCNEKNNLTEKKCVKCGYNFVEESVGMTAFSYGIEQHGDKFIVFYEKGTPFPVKPEDRVTKTRPTNFDNQRMMLVPIYGGESKNASQNEKQGDVFIVLPHGLPKGTGIKIKLWINKNGLFELQTMLETGETLQCIILRGRSDSKAVNEAYKKLDDYSTKKANISPNEQTKIEKQLNELLSKLINGEFEDAIAKLNEIEIKEEKGGDDGPTPAIDYQQALNMANNLLSQFGDYLSPTQRYQLQSKKEELTIAANNGNSLLAKKLADEIFRMFDDFMFELVEGKRMPTIFGLVIISQSLIIQAEQKNPSEVARQRLKEKREESLIEIRMGNKTKGMLDLSMIMLKAQEIIGTPTPTGMIECPNPKCKRMTPRNEPNCRYCGKAIIMGADQIGTDSSSYLNSFTTVG